MATNIQYDVLTLTTSAQTFATTGANEALTITRVQAYNSDTTARLVTIYQVDSGGTAGASNLVHRQTVYAGQSTSIDIAGLNIRAGAFLQALADVTSVVNLSANWIKVDQT